MRRLRDLGLLAAAALLVGSQAAQANIIGLDPSQVDLFTFNAAGSSVPLPSGNVANGSGRYTSSWSLNVSGLVTANWRLTGVNLGSAGDTFVLPISNTNENYWDFSVSINGGAPQGPLSLEPLPPAGIGVPHIFTFVGISGPVAQVDVFVSGTLPLPGSDRTAEFAVGTVPEPGSMILLGSGLLGLAGAVRRRVRR